MKTAIAPLDLLWFVMETQASPTHVGALLIFSKPGRRPKVVRELVDSYRSCRPAPPFNLVPVFGGAGVPHFRPTSAYDPCYHVQHLALPAGATDDDLMRLVADLHEPMLDRGRPLFRNWFIDGVPGNRFAVYAKVHHAIIDGVSGTKRLYASLSASPRRGVPTPAFAVEEPVHRPRPPRALVDRLAAVGLGATKQTFALRDVYLGALRKGLSTLLGAHPSGSMPFTAKHGPMNEPLQMARSFATLSLPLDEMRAVARRFDATLNDLSVTIVDAALHRHLRETAQGAFPHRLVAFCPVSLREDGDAASGTRVSAVFVQLGDPEADTVERLEQVAAALRAAKQEMRSMSKDAAMTYGVSVLGLAGLAAATHVDRVTSPLANLVISNVPGGSARMYLGGAPLLGTYPVAPLAVSIGLNVTLTSCHDRMDFGIVANASAMRDLSGFARRIDGAFRDLQAAAARQRRTRR